MFLYDIIRVQKWLTPLFLQTLFTGTFFNILIYKIKKKRISSIFYRLYRQGGDCYDQ